MYEERAITDSRFPKLKEFFTTSNTSWLVFGSIILAGIIVRIFLWDFTSSDMNVWKQAAELFLNGENPYETTLESFQNKGIKHFYAYFPLWMYISSLVLLVFPEGMFFPIIKGLILLFDIQVVILLYILLKPKVENVWRLKIPIAVWFITPMVLMTSSMHGKFDSLMFVFILLAFIFHDQDYFFLEAFFLGLAILTKPIALILVPFFFLQNVRERNFDKILAMIATMLIVVLLFSIPFLNDLETYIQGVLGVHVTREHDLGPIFALLSLPFSSESAADIIRMILTLLIIIVWIGLIILSYIKKYDLYKSSFLAFISFNSLYWVFLIQYGVWCYTLYIPFTTKSKMKHWHLALTTGIIIAFSTTALALMGAFVKHGL